MSMATTCAAVLATQLAFGGLGLFDCLKKDRHVVRGPDCCHACASEFKTVQNLILVAQGHTSWKQREKAVSALGKYDWRCHPDLVPSLVTVLLDDCHAKVRRSAADALAKLGPCDPTARVALQQAAMTDPDPFARKRSRKAIDRVGRRCATACVHCAPVVALPAAVEAEVALPPPARPGMADPYLPGRPWPGDPAARPELLPPALPPAGGPVEGPVEVLPPELPVPAPPSASPFGASSGGGDAPRPPARPPGPFRVFTIGRPS